LLARGRDRKWTLSHSSLYLDFLAGNQRYHCTPWAMPTRNVFGWQRPCYLLSEGYADTFQELMETTHWDSYGTGRYEKCADCMAHCGYEPTAVNDGIKNPLKLAWTALRGPKTTGPMVAEIPLDKQRPAEDVHEEIVAKELSGYSRAAE